MESKNELYPKVPQVNEMRIGNIMLDGEYNVVSVERINSDRIHEFTMVSQNNGRIYPSNIYKIAITKQWLEKLGFVKDIETDYRWFLPDGTITFDLDDYCVRISDSWEFGKRMYVNELQNLFFALTGKELHSKNECSTCG